MPAKNVTYLLCRRVAEIKPAVPSEVVSCCRCPAELWCADSSPPDSVPICFACVEADPELHAQGVEPPTVTQMLDIIRARRLQQL